jgi:hypothetical protein
LIPTLTLPFSKGGNRVEPAATVFPPFEKGRVRVGIKNREFETQPELIKEKIIRSNLSEAGITVLTVTKLPQKLLISVKELLTLFAWAIITANVSA